VPSVPARAPYVPNRLSPWLSQTWLRQIWLRQFWLIQICLGLALICGSSATYGQSRGEHATRDSAWVPLTVLSPTPGDDQVTFEFTRKGRTGAQPGLLVSDILLQAVDGPVIVRQLRVSVGREVVEFSVRKSLAPGEVLGPFAIKVSGAVTRIVVDLQPDRQSNGRLGVFVPATAAAGVAAILAPANVALPPTMEGMSQIATTTIGLAGARPAARVGFAKGRYTHILVRAQAGSVALQGVVIKFTTGETQAVAFPGQLNEGDTTLPIALERDAFVAEVEYLIAGTAGRAVLDLYGMLADGWTGDAGESKTYAGGWVLLGLRRPSNDAGAQETPITADVGRLKKLRFTARDTAVTLTTVTVVFDDGQRATYSVGQTLAKDATSQPIKLDETGAGRRITAILFPPSSKSAARRDSYVEVWAQN
jgi:hypothetical protein